MSEAAAQVQEPPQVVFQRLREWVVANCSAGHPVRHSAYAMALTANVHRMIKFGPDATLDHLTARDLMNLLIYTNGDVAEWMMRAAFARALIEDDRLVYETLANYPFMAECTAWYWRVVQAVIGQSPDPAGVTEWLNSLPPQEKSIARLLCARAYPDIAHIAWLDDVPEDCPAVAYQLAMFARRKENYQNAVDNWLRAHPMVAVEAYA